MVSKKGTLLFLVKTLYDYYEHLPGCVYSALFFYLFCLDDCLGPDYFSLT